MQEENKIEDQKATDKRKAPDKNSTGDDLAESSLIEQTPLKRARLEIEEEFVAPKDFIVMEGGDVLLVSNNKTEDMTTEPEEIESIPIVISETAIPQEIEVLDHQIKDSLIPLENGNKVEEEIEEVGNEESNHVVTNFFAEITERESINQLKTDIEIKEDNNNEDKLSVHTEKHQPLASSSPLSELDTETHSMNELEIQIKVYDPKKRRMIYENPRVISDYGRYISFMNLHNLNLTQSSLSSGYMGDVDSQDNTFSLPSTRKNRWTSSTLGSMIPRESIKTIMTISPKDSPTEEPDITSNKRGRNEPKMTSTKFSDDFSSISSETSSSEPQVERNRISKGVNGGDSPNGHASNNLKTLKGSTTKSGGPQKLSKSRTTSNDTPNRSKVLKNSDDKSGGVKKKIVAKKIRTTSREFAGVSSDSSFLSPMHSVEPSPVRGIATVEGAVAKPLTKFEEEVNNEPVDLATLSHSKTLWASIAPNNLVFARWRDKNYYSGLVKQKGLNDTWIIDYDDGMEDVASETHIVPIKILGVGVTGVYTPDGCFKPSDATVLGQKFVNDPQLGETVKYAIQLKGEERPIWCTRRQLSIKEMDARNLRADFMPQPKTLKAAEVSLENIVSGSRRRATANTSSSSTPNTGRKLLGGAFDESTAEESPSESKTPKRRGVKGNRKVSESSSGMSESSKVTEVIEKSVKESPKKIKTKGSKLFEGFQFFLTASGGGDPASAASESSAAVIPYDKDEYRDLIENQGGKVVDIVGKEKGKENIYLISDNYARTVKYIYCLAGSIPCVSHKWIQKCLTESTIVQWKPYELNSGWSLEDNKLVPSHRQKPLKGFEIYITAGSEDLYNYWKPVLNAAQAKLIKPKKVKGKIEDDIPIAAQVLVTDATCSPVVLQKAHEKMLPVVKPEWLVQSIISGKKADFFKHERYRVEILDTDDFDDDDDENDYEEEGDGE